MSVIDELEFLKGLHIANQYKVAALQEGIDAINTVNNIKRLLTTWRESLERIKDDVLKSDAWCWRYLQQLHLANELEACILGLGEYKPCPASK